LNWNRWIAVARSIHSPHTSHLSWHEGSADDLPWQEDSFDCILCAQTLQFLDRRPAALVEFCSVQRPGGRLVLSCWCDIRENPYFAALVSAVARHIDHDTAQVLGAAFRLGEADEILMLLEGSGFQLVRLERITLHLDLLVMAEFVPRHISATAMAAGFQAAPRWRQQAVRVRAPR
jgi:ubiquinone/menaquinone biosynthesis C-methylase UbiE